MKKNLMNVIACSAMVLAFAACNNNKVTHVAQIVDYRVHDANGALSRAADNSEPDPAPFVPSEDFEWELLDEIKLFDKGRGVKGPEFSKVTYKNAEGHLINCFKDECHDGDADWALYECDKDYYKMMKDAIKFEDDPDGVKLVFTKPAGYDNATFIVFQYIDGNGNRSTLIDRDDWGTFFNKGDFEIVYPQVIAGKPAQFWVMLNNENESQPGTNFFYKVTPAHGKGIVYDMQLDYDETDYISLDEGHIANIKKTIPPYAKEGSVQTILEVLTQNNGVYAWHNTTPTKLGAYVANAPAEAYTKAEGNETYEFTIDCLDHLIDEYTDAGWGNGFGKDRFSNDSHVFVAFKYRYERTEPEFEGYYFQTPEIKSMPVSNTEFVPEE